MFFCTIIAFLITFTASFFSFWFLLWQRKTLPKAPLEIGFRISKSSMEGAKPVLDEGLGGLLETKRFKDKQEKM